MPKVSEKTKKQTTKIRETKAVAKKPTKAASALQVQVYDLSGKVIETVTLPKQVFAGVVNKKLLAQAVRVYLANRRQGTVRTKTRGEVAISTRKIYRQKGTGRARHGAASAPIFVGGGTAFGPKPRDYSLSLSQKMKKAALKSALTSQAQSHAIKLVTGLEKLEPKTKIMAVLLKTIQQSKNQDRQKTLLVTSEKDEMLDRATRNIAALTVEPVNVLNALTVLQYKTVLFTKDAVEKLVSMYK